MKCPICKHSEVNPGQTTVTLERDGMAVVFRAWCATTADKPSTMKR